MKLSKQEIRLKKFEHLDIYFQWLDRDASQLHINEEQWERFHYMRLNQKKRNIKIDYPTKEKDYTEYYDVFYQYDIMTLVKAYRNKKNRNCFEYVVLSGKDVFAYWIYKHLKKRLNATDKNFNQKLVKKNS